MNTKNISSLKCLLKTSTLSLHVEDVDKMSSIYWCIVDNQNTSANTITFDFGNDVSKALNIIENSLENKKCKGFIITSAKESFIVGANIHLIQKLSNREEGVKENVKILEILDACAKFKSIIGRLKKLPFPSLALIHGNCMGGGLEIALGCTYRICTNSETTKFGFPEVKLGLIPAAGGCVYTPRLIGLINALDLIITGKSINADYAFQIGLVDKILNNDEKIFENVKQFLDKPKRNIPYLNIFFNYFLSSKLGKGFIYNQIVKKLHSNTKLKFIAPYWALDVIIKSYDLSEEAALLYESNCFVNVVRSNTSKTLVRLFLLQDKMKKIKSDFHFKKPNLIGVIGSGLIGSGISHYLLSKHYSIILLDKNEEILEKSKKRINSLFSLYKEKNIEEKLKKLKITTNHEDLMKCDLIFECVNEDIDTKKEIFDKFKEFKGTIISTTSSLILSKYRNIKILNFNYPVHKNSLVEIIKNKNINENDLLNLKYFVKSIGKIPIIVNECIGYSINRILFSFFMECIYMIEEGYPINYIQMKITNFGFPIILLQYLDAMGLDVIYNIYKNLCNAYPMRFKQSPLLELLYKEKHFGIKTRKGFCDYNESGEYIGQSKQFLQFTRKLSKKYTKDVLDRILFRILNESYHLLEEGIVQSEDDIDAICVMGPLNFPPEVGGIHWMFRDWSKEYILERMQKLEKLYGSRFTPNEYLKKLSKKGIKNPKNDNDRFLPPIDLQDFPPPRNDTAVFLTYGFFIALIFAFVIYKILPI